jgi:LacI family transcriptional regulator
MVYKGLIGQPIGRQCSGETPRGKQMATIRDRDADESDASITDVARHAKVSVGTVSRVFNQHPNVDSVLRRRVQIASRQLGFVPRVQRSCIALITGRRNPNIPPMSFVSVMTTLVSQYLADSRFAVELIDVENLDLLYEAHTQGAIGVTFDDRLTEALKIPKLPLITINHPMVQHGIHSVSTDHYRQGLLAAQHMIERGHRKIGLLAVDPMEWGVGERIRGYRDAFEAAGLQPDPFWIQGTMNRQVYDILSRWIGRGVTGILNFSEDVSFEVMHVLSNILKLRIGTDISVISLEDIAIYKYLNPPQTTVYQPIADLARIAVATMLDLCEGKPAKKILDLVLPTQLIERDSVATLCGR